MNTPTSLLPDRNRTFKLTSKKVHFLLGALCDYGVFLDIDPRSRYLSVSHREALDLSLLIYLFGERGLVCSGVCTGGESGFAWVFSVCLAWGGEPVGSVSGAYTQLQRRRREDTFKRSDVGLPEVILGGHRLLGFEFHSGPLGVQFVHHSLGGDHQCLWGWGG